MSNLKDDVEHVRSLAPATARAAGAHFEARALAANDHTTAHIWRGFTTIGADAELSAQLIEQACDPATTTDPVVRRFIGECAANLASTDAGRAHCLLRLAELPAPVYTRDEILTIVVENRRAGCTREDALRGDILEFDERFGAPFVAGTDLLAEVNETVLQSPELCARVVARLALDVWRSSDIDRALATLDLCTQAAPAIPGSEAATLFSFASWVCTVLLANEATPTSTLHALPSLSTSATAEVRTFLLAAEALMVPESDTSHQHQHQHRSTGASHFAELSAAIAREWRGPAAASHAGITDTIAAPQDALQSALAAVRAANAGTVDRCRERAVTGIELGVRDQNTWAASLSLAALGRLELSSGSPDVAFTILLRVADPDDACGHPITAHLSAPDLIDAALRAGRFDVAHREMARLAQWQRLGCTWSGAALARFHAVMAEPGTADDLFVHAIAVANDWTGAQARTRLAYGEYLRRTRRRVQARAELNTARELFTAAGHFAWVDRAQRELDATAHTAQRATNQHARLTQRESQIAELVAGGASNQATADRLVMSRKTVEHHLRNIYQRLGITSRKELSAALHEQPTKAAELG